MKRLMIAAMCVAATLAQAATSGSTVVDLGALGPAGSVPTTINNNGDVAGYSRSAASRDSAPYHGFLHQNGAMMDIGKPDSATLAQVLAMNDTGTLVAVDLFENGHIWR